MRTRIAGFQAIIDPEACLHADGARTGQRYVGWRARIERVVNAIAYQLATGVEKVLCVDAQVEVRGQSKGQIRIDNVKRVEPVRAAA